MKIGLGKLKQIYSVLVDSDREDLADIVSEEITALSLSKLHQHILGHDSGIITAYRSARDCGKGEPYTISDNNKRSKKLLVQIHDKGYSVTAVKGGYIENYGSPNAEEVKENSFFVVDINDRGTLKKDLQEWGEEYEQDSILFVSRGAEKGFVIGTNNCGEGYPGYGVVKELKNPILGEHGEFLTRVNERPFIFPEKNNVETLGYPQGMLGRQACHIISKKRWQDIEL